MPFARQRIRGTEFPTGFFHQSFVLEMLNECIYRLVRHSYDIRNVFDPQCSRIRNGRKHFANTLRISWEAWRLCATRGVIALGMVQTCCGDPIKSVTLKSLAPFDEATGNQTFKCFMCLVLGYVRREPIFAAFVAYCGGIADRTRSSSRDRKGVLSPERITIHKGFSGSPKLTCPCACSLIASW
jgi:hypothetical protein